jgi:hypothetical protein
MDRFMDWFAIAGQAFMVLSAAATITPTKKDDKVFTKLEAVGSALNVIGFDLKSIGLLFKKKF